MLTGKYLPTFRSTVVPLSSGLNRNFLSVRRAVFTARWELNQTISHFSLRLFSRNVNKKTLFVLLSSVKLVGSSAVKLLGLSID